MSRDKTKSIELHYLHQYQKYCYKPYQARSHFPGQIHRCD